jgi:hypothetical protein
VYDEQKEKSRYSESSAASSGAETTEEANDTKYRRRGVQTIALFY